MAVIDRDTQELFRKVRDQYPETYEWVKHKANWEGMPVCAVCIDYRDHIKELMAKEGGE